MGPLKVATLGKVLVRQFFDAEVLTTAPVVK